MANATIVWTPDTGWHNGQPATVYVDDHSRIHTHVDDLVDDPRVTVHASYLDAEQPDRSS
jgi:hypothetical protein